MAARRDGEVRPGPNSLRLCQEVGQQTKRPDQPCLANNASANRRMLRLRLHQ